MTRVSSIQLPARWALVGLVALGVGAARSAEAQERRGAEGQTAAGLSLELPEAVRFGDVVVPRGRYRVTVSSDGLHLVAAATMVGVATVPARESSAPAPTAVPTLELRHQGEVYEVIVRTQARMLVATGRRSDPPVRPSREVQLARRELPLEGLAPQDTATRSAMELLQRALARRYVRDVRHCGEAAQKGRWKTDDPRFVSCVCPLAARWRLPPQEVDTRVHQAIAPKKSGLSLTVDPQGKVKDCRVWVGPRPPAGEITGPVPPPRPEGPAPPPAAERTAPADQPPIAAEAPAPPAPAAAEVKP